MLITKRRGTYRRFESLLCGSEQFVLTQQECWKQLNKYFFSWLVPRDVCRIVVQKKNTKVRAGKNAIPALPPSLK